jgi:ribA/ribD-fused uncharacterized protein
VNYDPRCVCSIGSYFDLCPVGDECGNHLRMPLVDRIDSFRGKFSFLSNFHSALTCYEAVLYPTSEHAFQAAKSFRPEDREQIRRARTPAEAKKLGRYVNLRPDWDQVRTNVMFYVVLDKFARNPKLLRDLLATGDLPLIEGNTWGDTFWGQVNGEGENHLGKTLMSVRSLFRGDFFPYDLQVDLRNYERLKTPKLLDEPAW